MLLRTSSTTVSGSHQTPLPTVQAQHTLQSESAVSPATAPTRSRLSPLPSLPTTAVSPARPPPSVLSPPSAPARSALFSSPRLARTSRTLLLSSAARLRLWPLVRVSPSATASAVAGALVVSRHRCLRRSFVEQGVRVSLVGYTVWFFWNGAYGVGLHFSKTRFQI